MSLSGIGLIDSATGLTYGTGLVVNPGHGLTDGLGLDEGEAILYPLRLTNSQTFYAPGVALLTVYPGLVTDGDTFHAPIVTHT